MTAQETIWDERSALERLVHLLPGFRGYHVAENRREADALLRRFGRARLDRVRAELDAIARGKTGKARTPYRGLIRRLSKLCQALDRESHPGLLEPVVSTPSATLDPLYAQDEEIVRSVVALSVAIHERSTQPLDLTRELDRIERALAERRRLIDDLLH